MAWRTASAVALVLISALSASVSAQSTSGCFINGECYGGTIAGVNTGVDTAEACNEACKAQSTCTVGCLIHLIENVQICQKVEG